MSAKPPTSLAFSKALDNRSDSSDSTPIEDYKTPSIESASLPGSSHSETVVAREGEPRQHTHSHLGRTHQLSSQQQDWPDFKVNLADVGSAGFLRRHGHVKDTSTKVPQTVSKEMRPESFSLHGSQRESSNGDHSSILLKSRPADDTDLIQGQVSSTKASKRASFAALPNQTSWLQENNSQQASNDSAASSDLTSIRQKLDERRRQIESEKKRMEQQWSRQRQMVGKEAFVLFSNRDKQHNTSSTSMTELEGTKIEKPAYRREQSEGNMESQKDSTSPVLNRGNSANVAVQKLFANADDKSNHSKPDISSDDSPMKTAQQKFDSDRKTVTPSDRGSSEIGEYGSSLDRLNSSLTELQGEIMRLSLQQDQIKSLVGTDRNQPPVSVPSLRTSKSAAREQFYLFPQKSPSEPESPSLAKDRTLQSSSISHNVYRGSLPSSGVSPVQNYPPQSYPDMQSQQAYAMSQQTNPYSTYYSPYHSNRFFTPVSSQVVPASNQLYNCELPAYQPPPFSVHNQWQTYQSFPDTNSMLLSSRPINTSSAVTMQDSHSMLTNRTADPGLSYDHACEASPIRMDSYPEAPRSFSSQTADLSPPPSVTTSNADVYSEQTNSPQTMLSPKSSVSESGQPEPFHQASFFIIDSDLPPRRPKPVLSHGQRKKESAPSPRTSEAASPSPRMIVAASPPPRMSAAASPPPRMSAGSEHSSSDKVSVEEEPVQGMNPELFASAPCVGFVIEDSENTDPLLLSEVEKKRLKMAELHMKRKEELEMKKQKNENEQSVKREQQRMKQEKADQKKAEDRSRREAIYQQYLQRKNETDGSEDEGRTSSMVTPRHQQSSNSRTKLLRPKSQPAAMDNINNARDKTSSPCSELFKSSELIETIPPGSDPLDNRLSFGGLNNRGLSTPDRLLRFGSGSDGGSDGASENYAGPKLYVKPNQKSNRHIIINAIKDCCLAGVVNQDVKSKVMEEISRSDSKHFVILFRDAGQQYRGLYTYNPDREEVFKIHGVGPKQLFDKTMEKFFKYNSGAKNFSEITSTKHLSATIDAVTILSSLWQKKLAPSQGKR